MHSPLLEQIEKSARYLMAWFFTRLVFATAELKAEALRYFETGETSFRFFEWLNLPYMRRRFPGRWKVLVADFAAAYIRLCLFCAALTLSGLVLFGLAG